MRINYHYAENFNRNLLDFLLSIGFAKAEVLDEYVQLAAYHVYSHNPKHLQIGRSQRNRMT